MLKLCADGISKACLQLTFRGIQHRRRVIVVQVDAALDVGEQVTRDGDPGHLENHVASEPVGSIHVLVPGETTENRLAKETDNAVPANPAGATVGDNIARQCGQPEGVVKLAIGKQTGVGGDTRSVDLQL
jgi:hypothetical protein